MMKQMKTKRWSSKMTMLIFLIGINGWVSISSGQELSGETQGRGLSFIPDYVFKGSGMQDWQEQGNAQWEAQDGELIGKANTTAMAGCLVLNRSFQDISINTLIKVTGEAEAGIIFRLEQDGDGMKGVLATVKDGEGGAYAVRWDEQGRELSRKPLRHAGGMIRVAPPADPNESEHRGTDRRPQGNDRLRTLSPIVRPETTFRPGDWNQLEFVLDMNILRGYINDGNGPGGAADEDLGKYGPIALYIKGPGAAHFKDFKYKNIAMRYTPKEETSARFRIQQISDMYYAWSAAAADFNRDGVTDLAAGPYIYYGPDYTTFSEIFQGITFNPSNQFTETNCQYAYDFDGDGWVDIFNASPFGRLYMNPKGASRRWDEYAVIPGNINSEITVFRDIDGDGRPEVIYGTSGDGGFLKYSQFDPADPTKPWKAHVISEAGYYMAHGIGVGDINGDGRMDILNPNGWWEQPRSLETDTLWTYHPIAFGRYGHRASGVGGSVMAVYDVNGDQLNDVVTSLNAHGFGLAWFEQKRDAQGNISFVRHMIMDDYATKNAGNVTFSELHGSTFGDVDGDGLPDFIVGKRFWSHVDTYLDPDPYGPPVLYWYRTVRNPKAPGGAEFVPELVHNRSGAGSDLLATDLDQDGHVDIITSTNRGTFIFWNKGVDGK